MPYPFARLPFEIQKQICPLLQHIEKEIQVADSLRKNKNSQHRSAMLESIVLDREFSEESPEPKHHYCNIPKHKACLSVPYISKQIRVEAVSGIDNDNNFIFWGEFSVIPFLNSHNRSSIEHITLHISLESPHIDRQAGEWKRIIQYLETNLELETFIFKGIDFYPHFLDLNGMKNDPMRWVASLAFMFGSTSLTLEAVTPFEMVDVLDDPTCLEKSLFRWVRASDIELRFRRI